MRLSPTYWLRRWLVPELEPSPAEIARRRAEYEEGERARASMLAELDALATRRVAIATACRSPKAPFPPDRKQVH